MRRDIELLYEVGSLRFLDRNWKRFLNADFSSVAEHTLRVAWIALVIAKEEGADAGKVLELALIHDLPESRTNDLDYLSSEYSTRQETEALTDISAGTVLEEDLRELWQEWKARESPESKIVKDADNLDVDMELQEQQARGMAVGTIWREQRERVFFPKLYTETARRLWKEIRESNPHDWHLNARNRFNKK
jgi:putative hydrolase of HD superfamily